MGIDGTPPRTQVFPSITDAPEGMHLKAEAMTSLPRPPGATTMLRLEDRNKGPTEGNTTVTEVAKGSPATLAKFYRQELEQRGYAQKEARSEPRGVELLDFQKPGERLSLSLSPMGDPASQETLVTVVLERIR